MLRVAEKVATKVDDEKKKERKKKFAEALSSLGKSVTHKRIDLSGARSAYAKAAQESRNKRKKIY